MTYISRYLEPDIKSRMFTGKAIIVYGPRQCGKTTMIRHITNEWINDVLWLNGDSPARYQWQSGRVFLQEVLIR